MAKTEGAFELFRDMIESISPIYITQFDSGYHTLYTNVPNEEWFRMLHRIQGSFDIPFESDLEKIAVKLDRPIIYTNRIGMTWLSDVEFENNQLSRIYLLGPVFLDDFSLRRVEPEVDLLQLSVPLKHKLLSLLRELPVITLNRYIDFGIMLHRAITGKVITASDYIYPDHYNDRPLPRETLRDFHGVYTAERKMLKMIEEGNIEYQKEKKLLQAVSDHIIPNVTGDYIRQLKNTLIALCVLYSRAAIRGGVETETAYTMSDLYIQQIESSDALPALRDLSDELAEAFTRAVRRHKTREGVSPQINKACDYIGIHLEEKITIREMAEKFGYTEYYFSSKFKKEMGVSFREYIHQKRIEKAAEILSSTNRDIQEISVELGYESPSYFCEIFKKVTGISPGEYRSRNR